MSALLRYRQISTRTSSGTMSISTILRIGEEIEVRWSVKKLRWPVKKLRRYVKKLRLNIQWLKTHSYISTRANSFCWRKITHQCMSDFQRIYSWKCKSSMKIVRGNSSQPSQTRQWAPGLPPTWSVLSNPFWPQWISNGLWQDFASASEINAGNLSSFSWERDAEHIPVPRFSDVDHGFNLKTLFSNDRTTKVEVERVTISTLHVNPMAIWTGRLNSPGGSDHLLSVRAWHWKPKTNTRLYPK